MTKSTPWAGRIGRVNGHREFDADGIHWQLGPDQAPGGKPVLRVTLMMVPNGAEGPIWHLAAKLTRANVELLHAWTEDWLDRLPPQDRTVTRR